MVTRLLLLPASLAFGFAACSDSQSSEPSSSPAMLGDAAASAPDSAASQSDSSMATPDASGTAGPLVPTRGAVALDGSKFDGYEILVWLDEGSGANVASVRAIALRSGTWSAAAQGDCAVVPIPSRPSQYGAKYDGQALRIGTMLLRDRVVVTSGDSCTLSGTFDVPDGLGPFEVRLEGTMKDGTNWAATATTGT